MLKGALSVILVVVLLSLIGPRRARSLRLGRLPGDLRWTWRGRPMHLPLATALLLSALATLLGRLL